MVTGGMRSWHEVGTSQFRIPSLPPSVNALYCVNHAQRKIFLKPEVRLWKTQAKLFMPKLPDPVDTHMFKLEATFTYNWIFKNGAIRKFDTQNMMKVLIDAVSERYGFDDSLVKWGSHASVHDEKAEYVDVKLTQMQEQVAVTS